MISNGISESGVHADWLLWNAEALAATKTGLSQSWDQMGTKNKENAGIQQCCTTMLSCRTEM